MGLTSIKVRGFLEIGIGYVLISFVSFNLLSFISWLLKTFQV